MLSPEARLALDLVRATPSPVDALRSVARTVDGERLATLTVREGVAPLLHARLAAAPALAALVPAPARAAWERMAGVTWARSAIFRAAWRDAVAALAAAGVPSITLKGLALVERGAYDPAWRPMTDVDVLVHAHDLAGATAALGKDGWQVVDVDDLAEPGGVHLRRGDVMVDLHTEIAAYPRVRSAVRVDHAALWARSRPLGAAAAVRVLADEDMVLHLALHLVLGAEFGRLLNYVDVDRAIRRPGVALDWDRLLEEARRWGIAGVVAYTLGVVAAGLGTPVPPPSRLPSFRARVLARCVPTDVPPSLGGTRSDAALYLAETVLLDGWPAIGRVIAWTLFPSRGWLRRHYRTRSALALGFARVGHPVRVCWRVARGVR